MNATRWGSQAARVAEPAPRRRAAAWIAGGVTAALVVTIAVFAGGYDARDTPRVEPGVWVARDAGQYARVNTDTGELDTVRRVAEPSSVLQSGAQGVLLTHGNGRAWPIAAAQPWDVGGAATEGDADGTTPVDGSAARTTGSKDGGDSGDVTANGVAMPEGTREVLVAGRYLAARTESGQVHVGTLRSAGSTEAEHPGLLDSELEASDWGPRLAALRTLAETAPADPGTDADTGTGTADSSQAPAQLPAAAAIALSADGVLAVYAGAEHTVTRYDLERGLERTPEAAAAAVPTMGSPDALTGEPVASPQLALVGSDWVLLDPDAQQLIRSGAEPQDLELAPGPLLQLSSGASRTDAPGSATPSRAADPAAAPADRPARSAVLIADSEGLVTVARDGTETRTAATGTPARPTEVDGVRVAAWLGAGSGALWRGGGDPLPLQFDDAVQDESDVAPVIRSNGTRAVLSDERTGMLWTIPDGALIPLSQWSLADPPQEVQGTVVVEDVPEQVPPTAVDDAFGVRPGVPSPLPVLLNDLDPNARDVLTIVPESLSESSLPESFGSVELLADRQSLVLHTAPGAAGTASFTYRISDGALESGTATVTVRVVNDEENSAPEWCPVSGCQREWGVPAIVPGGTLVTPVLEGWVDPEGDVMTLAAAVPVRDADPIRALVTADGRLAVRHTDPGAGGGDVALRITVRDSRGAERDRELTLPVRAEAMPEVTGTAATMTVGVPATFAPLDRVAGGSGSFALVDVAPQSGEATAVTNPVGGTVEVTALDPGVSTFAVTVRDAVTGAEASGPLRVTASEDGAALALPPLRAYVRPLADATVEVLDAIPGAESRALAVVGASVADGELQADVIDHAQVRVAGATPDGTPGRIGAADITVSEGDATARGRLTVFQVPDAGGTGVIAVADAATVSAGSTVDIRVLDNDVAAPGERLLLHPEVTGSGAPGELAFAAGGTLRYLAPTEPGTYRVGYTVFAASSPELSDTGEVVVTVLPTSTNRDPQPPPLTARVTPGGTTIVRVPSSGVDPDGDRVRLRGVELSPDTRVTASLARSGTGIEVTASATAEPGTIAVSYSVTDDHGGTGTGIVNVVVTGEAGAPPVTLTDQVRLVPGGSTVVQPLENDSDPAGGELELQEVTPNVPGGSDSAEYRRLVEALDTRELRRGRISVTAGEELGTASYRYTVRSSATSSTADGLIVVQTSERVGAQAPAVRDTLVSVRDRADLEGRGIDVLQGKVRWTAGDPAALKLTLWGEQGGDYRVSGNRITGNYDPAGDVVVFQVDGTDASGTDVTSYGFLVIPPLEDLQLTLQRDLEPLEVAEGDSVTAALTELVDAGPSDRIELRSGAFPTARPAARCEAVGDAAIRYEAGSGGPWNDVCRMEVRLRGQQSWTALPVPVRVIPDAPVAELRSLTRTIAPGEAESIELTDMVEWQGDRTGDPGALSFSVSGSAADFDVVTEGATLRATALSTARPGGQHTLTVTMTGAGRAHAPLTLRVGESPRDLPRGGTVALQRTVGASCGVELVGISGEHDPFAGKRGGGLELVAVDGSACPIAQFTAVENRRVAVSWPDATGPGGTCTVGFTVRDAQGRVGAGSIEFDAQGLPDTPTSVVQTGFTESSATFRVALGGRLAHPAVTEVRLAGAGNAQCVAAGPDAFDCVVSGLRSGERHSFTARAVNGVGESVPSAPVTGWAYRAPERPTITATALPDAGNTDQGRGTLRVTASGSRDTREFRVSIAGVDRGTIAGPEGRGDFAGLPAGPVPVVVTPVTALELPPVSGGSATGTAAQTEGRVFGAPMLTGATLASTGDRSGKITVVGTGAHHGEAVAWSYAVATDGADPSCEAAGSSAEISQLQRGKWYRGVACARSPYGASSATTAAVQIGGAIPAPSVSYTVATAPEHQGGELRYLQLGGAAVSGQLPEATLRYSSGGATLFLDAEAPGPITVQQCFGEQCSEAAPVRWIGAPRPVNLAPSGTCVDPATAGGNPAALAAAVKISGAARPSAQFTLGAVAGETAEITVRWGGDYGALQAATLTVCAVPPPAPGP
ncbi:Fibronectin, type III domain protein [Leucobacter sp. 7(1)]|uniref:Ig-like domain-containing protein n=1 Tax=Leucobacter sp. 7(1) TaxID=1255613 RepID=UPI00097E9552|nr:Ig-like domain-containing protein [Leucobacter sp. 7(1)]SJN09503.1 Fibronectin, type III domain protein [Leucobacter sp. 7(1)]